MDSSEIKQYKKILEERNRCYTINNNYASGKNPVILNDRPKKDPDNRIPIPLGKMAVTDMSGYAGRAGDTDYKIVKTDDITDDQLKEYTDLVVKINAHNKVGIENAELYEEALTQGVAYELFWTSDDLELSTVTPEYKIIPSTEIVPVYSNDLKPRLLKAVRFSKDGEISYVDVYYPLYAEHYIMSEDSGDYVPVLDEPGMPKITEYPYKSVPLAVYPINRHKKSLFEAEKPLIDAHDNIISKSVNEIDRFNALIALLPGKVTKEFVDKLQEMKVIDDLGQFEMMPSYLEKNLQGVNDYTNKLLDRIERQFHKSIKIPDMTSEQFAGGEQSGVAIAYKLIGLEFSASQIDTYFDQGLNKRIELINDVLESSYSYVNDIEVKITHKRNLPVDEKAKIEQALLLKGNISNEAYLRMFPKSVIPSIDEELERMEEEPDKELLELFVLAMQAGKPVPAQYVAKALRIEESEWLRLTAEEQMARLKSMSIDDEDIEKEFIDSENTEGAVIDQEGAGVQMNGAQVTSATGIVKDVAEGKLPKQSGINMLKSFFNLSQEQAEALFAGVKEGSVTE